MHKARADIQSVRSIRVVVNHPACIFQFPADFAARVGQLRMTEGTVEMGALSSTPASSLLVGPALFKQFQRRV